MVCIDTDILIDLLRKDPSTVKKISEIKDQDEELSTTTINSFELLKGALRSKQKDAKESTNKLIRNLKILDFDYEASEEAAEIFEDLRVKGMPLDPMDLMVASVAIANGESLLTGNIKHFERIKNLKLEH
jgi:tRNA(fMet)-specific endonuclease VapC